MELYTKWSRKTVKELKADPIYSTINGRSKMKKDELVREFCKKIKTYSGTMLFGPFTGVRRIDMLILLFMKDKDLINLCTTNKNFQSFLGYEQLWKMKIIARFGHSHIENIHDYDGDQWKGYYFRLLAKRVKKQGPKHVWQ